MEAEIELGRRQAGAGAETVERGDAVLRRLGRGQRPGASAGNSARMPSPISFSTPPPWPSIAEMTASA